MIPPRLLQHVRRVLQRTGPLPLTGHGAEFSTISLVDSRSDGAARGNRQHSRGIPAARIAWCMGELSRGGFACPAHCFL